MVSSFSEAQPSLSSMIRVYWDSVSLGYVANWDVDDTAQEVSVQYDGKGPWISQGITPGNYALLNPQPTPDTKFIQVRICQSSQCIYSDLLMLRFPEAATDFNIQFGPNRTFTGTWRIDGDSDVAGQALDYSLDGAEWSIDHRIVLDPQVTSSPPISYGDAKTVQFRIGRSWLPSDDPGDFPPASWAASDMVDTPFTVTVTGGTGSGDYHSGTTVNIQADAPAAGDRFTGWTTDGIVLADATAPSTSFTMPANDVTVTARFEPIPLYPVTVKGGSGSGSFAEDALVTITANLPATGNRFTQWATTGIALANPGAASASFLMPANAVTATAEYEAIPYQVTVANGTGGGTFHYGDDVTVTADEPAEGFKFDRWQTTGITLEDPELPELTFSMPTNNVTLTATYWQVEVPRFQVTVIGGTGSGQFPVGEQVTVTANPAQQGWVFDGWQADGVTLPDPLLPETTFPMPGRDVTLTATYEEMPSEPGPDGSTLTITPESGNGPPSVSILVGGVPAGTRFTVQRFVEGDVWRNVHGATDVESSGSAAPVHDWAIPLGVRVFYRVIVDGKPGARAETRIPTSSQSWIQDAYSPRNGLRVSVRALDPYGYGPDAFRQAAWPQPVSEVLVLGAAYPVASVGVRARQGNIPIEIACDSIGDASRLRDFLFTTGILLIRGAPCVLLQPFAFVVIPDLVETHLGNPHEVAVFTGTAMLVREPDESLAISMWTYDRVLEQIPPGSTYDDVKRATGDITYDDAFANPHLVGGAQTRPTSPRQEREPRGLGKWRARLGRMRREG